MKKEEKIFVNLDEPNDIITFGNEAMSQVAVYTKKMSERISDKSESVAIIGSLNRIMGEIDYKELNTINSKQQSRGIARIFNIGKSAKEKLVAKYSSISSQIENMYTTVNRYQSDINETTVALGVLQAEVIDANALLQKYIDMGVEMLNAIKDDGNHEKYNMLAQKIQDLQYSHQVNEQTVAATSVMIKTNREITKKLISVYSTTLPIIQSQVNMFKVLKEQGEIISSISVIEEKRNEILQISSSETISMARKSVEMLGYTKEDFEVVVGCIDNLRNGLEEIVKLQQSKSEKIKSMIGG